MTLSPSRIVCAACKLPNGLIVTSARHWDMVMHRVCEALQVSRADKAAAIQGFIDQHGKFFTREDAFHIANGNDQIREHPSNIPGVLFSEDLY